MAYSCQSEFWDALEARDHKHMAMLVNSGRMSLQIKHPLFGNPLHCVARAGLLGAVQMMLRRFPTGINLQTEKEGRTALHIAVSENHMDVVRALLDARANPDIQDKLGLTALHIAVMSEFADAVKLLLVRNAAVHIRSMEGYTAAHLGTSHMVFVSRLTCSALLHSKWSELELLLAHKVRAYDVQDNKVHTTCNS